MAATLPTSVPCWVYKGRRKEGIYLYLATEDGFKDLPEALRTGFGDPRFVMGLGLHPGSRLARGDVRRVIENLRDRGVPLTVAAGCSALAIPS